MPQTQPQRAACTYFVSSYRRRIREEHMSRTRRCLRRALALCLHEAEQFSYSNGAEETPPHRCLHQDYNNNQSHIHFFVEAQGVDLAEKLGPEGSMRKGKCEVHNGGLTYMIFCSVMILIDRLICDSVRSMSYDLSVSNSRQACWARNDG